jgi:hypothetical protein
VLTSTPSGPMIRRFNVGTLGECMDSWHYECLGYCGVKEIHSSAHSAVARFLATIICVGRRQMPRHQPAILNMHVHVHNMKNKHIDIKHVCEAIGCQAAEQRAGERGKAYPMQRGMKSAVSG